jgi:hypothetical protein
VLFRSQSRWRRAADVCVLETDLTGGQYGMAEEFTEKINLKNAGVRVLVRFRSPGVQEPCEKKLKHQPPSLFSFTT